MKRPTFLTLLSMTVYTASFSRAFRIATRITRQQQTARTLQQGSPLSAASLLGPPANAETEVKEEPNFNVRAPLKFIGPYPCLGVRFPYLATTAQQERNESGVTLDFVLDTAANTNTINAQVAQALNLTVIGQAPPGMGSAGPIKGDLPTFFLGDMQLEGLGEEIFMQNLTASSLPIASPASAGLLSLSFFQSIGEGVGFDWHGDIEARIPPSLTFYSDATNATQGRKCVQVTRRPLTQLPSVEVEINGHVFPALLDTGSPITVLNAQAARTAGITTALDADDQPKNPLNFLKGRFEQAQAASRRQLLTIFGSDGRRHNLLQSNESLNVRIPTVDHDVVDFGRGHVYVGNLPGLAALQGLGDDAPPAIVLGMDVLRRNRHMYFRPLSNQVWF